MTEFIRYEEVYSILHEKYKATHDELLYWIHLNTAHYIGRLTSFISELDINDMGSNTPLCCFVSDIECKVKYYKGFRRADENFSYPYGFFVKEHVLNYIPNPELRFITLQDLHNRFWRQWDRLEEKRYSSFPSLDKAAQNGILNFYDDERREFSTHCQYLGKIQRTEPILWINTDIGQRKLNDPNTPFLAYDIISIERIFEGKSLDECMKELQPL